MSRFLDEPGHRGYCRAHGRYACEPCAKADARDRARDNDFGVFEWRSDGRYTRGTAIAVRRREADARKIADEMEGNVVVRAIRRRESDR